MEQSLTLIREDAKRVGLDLDHAENLDAVKVEQVLYRRDQRMKREGW